jgi:hypothetical protein
MPVIPAFRRLAKDHKLEASLGYIASFKANPGY